MIRFEEMYVKEELESGLECLIVSDSYPNTFYRIKYKDDIIAGLETNNIGYSISYLIDDEKLYFGVNSKYYCIDLSEKKLVMNDDLNSIYMDVVKVDQYKLVVCELDIYCYKNDKLLWKNSAPDMIVDYRVEGMNLYVNYDNGVMHRYNVESGK